MGNSYKTIKTKISSYAIGKVKNAEKKDFGIKITVLKMQANGFPVNNHH